MDISEKIVHLLSKLNLTISTMESCTGGYIINSITNIEGSSKVTAGGYVTYSNQQKINCGVSKQIIEQYGVYSQECATEMARVTRQNTSSNIGVGVTGTLSNVDEANPDSKRGEVHFCIYLNDGNLINNSIQVPIMKRSLQKEYILGIILNQLFLRLN